MSTFLLISVAKKREIGIFSLETTFALPTNCHPAMKRTFLAMLPVLLVACLFYQCTDSGSKSAEQIVDAAAKTRIDATLKKLY